MSRFARGKDRAKRDQVSDELVDVLILCLGFSDVMGIDISEAIEAKLRKAADKYPVMKTSPKGDPESQGDRASS